MATIRTVHPTDLVSLIAFLRNGSRREVTARVWPEVDDPDPRMVRDLISRILSRPGGSQVWVSLGNGRVDGMVVARSRAGKLAWEVEGLHVAEGARPVGVDLLDHVAVEAARKGARRVFLATPVDSDLVRIASQAGFANYTSERLYSLQLPSPVVGSGLHTARPRLRQDTQAIFQLYNAAVPCRVRMAEAMTIDEWHSLDRGNRMWAPSLGGNRQDLVWEKGGIITGWVKLTFGGKSQHLQMLVHPTSLGAADEMIQHSLSQRNHRAPIYVSTREYQTELISILERREFARVAEYLIYARELAARVPHRVLVPARA